MAEELKLSCGYCDSEHTQLEFALHKVSNSHVKKVQKKVFQQGFSSVCLVCNSTLKNFKQLELHVKEKEHTERMKSYLLNSFLSTDKCTCGSCGVAFYNEVVLEAHRLLDLHDSTTIPPHTPKLNDIIRHLSGICRTQVLSNGYHLCNVCNVTLDGVESSVMHLFTPAHVVRLRSSSCMVCKKDFTHASDREAHLRSTKHLTAVEKCSDILEEGCTQSLLRRGGYPCMFCMIWCNSWLCLEIHLLNEHHSRVLVQYKSKQPLPSRITFLAVPAGNGATPSCDESAMSNWKHWRGEALEEGIWCHKCGVTLIGIDEANRHLDKGDTERCRATGTLHSSPTSVSRLTSVPEIYECSVCAMSFKNALVLSAHTACLEHHRRLAAFNSTALVQCCSSCGLLVDNIRHHVKEGPIFLVKGTDFMSKSLHLSQSQVIGCHVVSEATDLGVASSLNGNLQSAALLTANEKRIEEKIHFGYSEENRLLVTNGSNKGHSNFLEVGLVLAGGRHETGSMNRTAVNPEKDATTSFIECGPLMDQTLHTTSNDSVNLASGESGCLGWSRNVSRKSANGYVSGNGILTEKSHGNVAANTSTECTNVHAMNKDSLHSEVGVADGTHPHTMQSHLPLASAKFADSLTQQNKDCCPGQVSHDNDITTVKCTYLADVGVPIIVAATLAPLGNLQESLQSIAAIVTESLSSALPKFYVQQSTSSIKRKSQGDLNETVDQTHLKRVCTASSLEAAVRQGLGSVSSSAPKLDTVDPKLYKNCPEITMVRQNSIGDETGREGPRAVLAVAASLIPSDLPNLSRLDSEQATAVVSKEQETGMEAFVNDNTSQRARISASNVKSESLSQGLVGDQDLAKRMLPEKVVEERSVQAEVSQLQPDSAVACPDIQNYTQSLALAPPANEVLKDEGFLGARPSAPSVNATSHNSRSENNYDDNDEEDDYAFLDPTKGGAKWWTSSDSDDSDSM